MGALFRWAHLPAAPLLGIRIHLQGPGHQPFHHQVFQGEHKAYNVYSSVPDRDPHHFGSRIRIRMKSQIRIKVKSRVRMRIKSEIEELKRLKILGCSVIAHPGAAWIRMSNPDLHQNEKTDPHQSQKQDPDTHQVQIQESEAWRLTMEPWRRVCMLAAEDSLRFDEE
jgi:hypothetical protein